MDEIMYWSHIVFSLRLINKLQPGSVKKINLSQLNWHKVRLVLKWKSAGLQQCQLTTKSCRETNRSEHYEKDYNLLLERSAWRKTRLMKLLLLFTNRCICTFIASWLCLGLCFTAHHPFLLCLSFSAAGEPWELHQSYIGLWPKAQWHLWGQWPVWKWEHDSSPDHTAGSCQHGEWIQSAKVHSLLTNTFCIVKGNKRHISPLTCMCFLS